MMKGRVLFGWAFVCLLFISMYISAEASPAVDELEQVYIDGGEERYKLDAKGPDDVAYETSVVFGYFEQEPSIKAVQEAAVSYAEVHPDKITRWRRAAAVRGILPRVSFGYDFDQDETYEIYTSSATNYSITGPEKNSKGWDISLTWELSDLIWNSSHTTIDVRSKLMVQLRWRILREVTGLYYERRRLQTDLLLAPPESIDARVQKELRIQELTGQIDALTGGYLSRYTQR
ncbi:MAG: hypothetical protein HQ593_01530 [Candidatus Omnitrophica bacterium]|nr:hypothetical protein [Candidatus Omnitrophota bacterium]